MEREFVRAAASSTNGCREVVAAQGGGVGEPGNAKVAAMTVTEPIEGTVFVVVTNENDPGNDWPEGRSHIRTLVKGALADRVRTRTGKAGDVHLDEIGEEGGYSEYTVEWYYEFRVEVGGETVFDTDSYSSMEEDPVANARWSGFGHFMSWLDNP